MIRTKVLESSETYSQEPAQKPLRSPLGRLQDDEQPTTPTRRVPTHLDPLTGWWDESLEAQEDVAWQWDCRDWHQVRPL